jgi:hypothetical protein
VEAAKRLKGHQQPSLLLQRRKECAEAEAGCAARFWNSIRIDGMDLLLKRNNAHNISHWIIAERGVRERDMNQPRLRLGILKRLN